MTECARCRAKNRWQSVGEALDQGLSDKEGIAAQDTVTGPGSIVPEWVGVVCTVSEYC
jgi:hypothetical protein